MPAMRSTRSSSLLAAVGLMAAGMFSPAMQGASDGPALRPLTASQGAPKSSHKAPVSPEQRAAWLRVRSSRAARRRFGGLGWSVAHDRRMARKRRNVIKARRAKRG